MSSGMCFINCLNYFSYQWAIKLCTTKAENWGFRYSISIIGCIIVHYSTSLFFLTINICAHQLLANITPLCLLVSKQFCSTHLQQLDATHVAFTHNITLMVKLRIFIFGAQYRTPHWSQWISVGNTIHLTSTPNIQCTYTLTKTCALVVDILSHYLHSIQTKPHFVEFCEVLKTASVPLL
jgi:hypothetical protein